MAKFLLNYASDRGGDLYSECMGIFDNADDALAERNEEIIIDREDYNKEEGHSKDYDEYVRINSDLLYEWTDGEFTQQYRIQEML